MELWGIGRGKPIDLRILLPLTCGGVGGEVKQYYIN
jgi:hypothetical protein